MIFAQVALGLIHIWFSLQLPTPQILKPTWSLGTQGSWYRFKEKLFMRQSGKFSGVHSYEKQINKNKEKIPEKWNSFSESALRLLIFEIMVAWVWITVGFKVGMCSKLGAMWDVNSGMIQYCKLQSCREDEIQHLKESVLLFGVQWYFIHTHIHIFFLFLLDPKS